MKEYLSEVLLDGLIDVLKLIPFLFIAFLILEYIEHKMSKKNKEILFVTKTLLQNLQNLDCLNYIQKQLETAKQKGGKTASFIIF